MPHFTYNIVDINEISYELGIPWEASKDQPFATSTIYIGFVWNLAQCMITLSSNKTEKYINEINIWLERWTYMLKHVQELYEKLLHAASILPQGQAYVPSRAWKHAVDMCQMTIHTTPPR